MTRQFLSGVFGDAAAEALLTSADRGTVALRDAVSRAALAWAREALAGHRGSIPGLPLTLMAKGEAWEVSGQGELPLGGFGAPGLAAAALLLWGLEPSAPEAGPADLARLGKALDGLAKAARRRDIAGPAAAPLAPQSPEPPTPAQPTQTAPPPASGKPQKPKLPKLPGAKKPRQAVFTKGELSNGCRDCGSPQMVGSYVVGCSCFGTLMKSVKVDVGGDGRYMLSFGASWDDEDFLAFVRGTKR